MVNKSDAMYQGWLSHNNLKDSPYQDYFRAVLLQKDTNYLSKIEKLIDSSLNELKFTHAQIFGNKSILPVYQALEEVEEDKFIYLHLISSDKAYRTNSKNLDSFSFMLYNKNGFNYLKINAYSPIGLLYGIFGLLRFLDCNETFHKDEIWQTPSYSIRMINHLDNLDGTVERGYAGSSIFFEAKRNKALTKSIMEEIGLSSSSELIREALKDDYDIAEDRERIHDYGRLLCSIGINSIVINNSNVHTLETKFIDSRLDIVRKISDILAYWGIKTYISINYAAPIILKELDTSDPLDIRVGKWWKEKTAYLYSQIPDLGGFMVKSDTKGQPGPFAYGRSHTDVANMLGEALKPFGGILIYRCFVFNDRQDWRDRVTDRAKLTFDTYTPLDGEFLDNVYLQIKNGPMDFQVREPISPLFSAMDETNKFMELQITGEYTGQQKHVCYLVPYWSELLNTKINTKETISDHICGVSAVSNIGNDSNWTGHTLALANLYGYARLIWDTSLSSEEIAKEWIIQTFGFHSKVCSTILHILLDSWHTYENYTSPLGTGYMVSPKDHYSPDVDGYEYSRLGIYHLADHKGIGRNRTIESGTGFVGQYKEPLRSRYNHLSTCPDELLLFFHHVPYTHVLHSGKTVIQHIYDSHFEGYEQVKDYITKWKELKGLIPDSIYSHTLDRLQTQLGSARDWCDQINSYFYRLSDIKDEKGRTIY